jgi:hypothetical protein
VVRLGREVDDDGVAGSDLAASQNQGHDAGFADEGVVRITSTEGFDIQCSPSLATAVTCPGSITAPACRGDR